MAVKLKPLKKTVKKKGGGYTLSRISQTDLSKLTLPTEKTVPMKNMPDYTWLIYGERHIGKTELASLFEDPFFLFFEPGGKAQSVFGEFCPTWEHFLRYIELLEANPDYCRTVVIDVGGKCYNMCFDYTCRELGIQHPQDEGRGGKGWKMVDRYFIEAHNRIFAAGFGIIALAHSEVRSISKSDGSSVDKLTIRLGAQPFDYYCGTFDTTAYYHYNSSGKRILTIKGSENVEAGTRCKHNFKFTDGTSITDISMGESAEEAYRNLKLAFENKLVRKGGGSRIKTKLSNK